MFTRNFVTVCLPPPSALLFFISKKLYIQCYLLIFYQQQYTFVCETSADHLHNLELRHCSIQADFENGQFLIKVVFRLMILLYNTPELILNWPLLKI